MVNFVIFVLFEIAIAVMLIRICELVLGPDAPRYAITGTRIIIVTLFALVALDRVAIQTPLRQEALVPLPPQVPADVPLVIPPQEPQPTMEPNILPNVPPPVPAGSSP